MNNGEYVKELSVKETSVLLNVSSGAVRVTLHRARVKLLK